MRNAWPLICGVAVVSTLIVSGSGSMQAQTHPEVADAGKAWTQKTPWGDPDLAGAWTSDDMRGVPRERAADLGTRRYLNDEEFGKRLTADTQGRDREANRSGGFRNDTGTRTFRQTSLVIDPPDGRIPAFTPYAESRRATRDRGSFGEGPFDSTHDFTLYDRCITRGVIGSILPVVYGNGNRWSQSPGYRHGDLRDDSRHARDPARWPPASQSEDPSVSRRRARSLGRQYARDRDDELHGSDEHGGGNGNGLRHSDALRLTERVTRIDAQTMEYIVTVDDPRTYVKPFTMLLDLTQRTGYAAVLPYECHEGNYMLRNSLSAERAEDRALEADAKKGITRARKAVQGNINAVPAPAEE